MTPTLAAGSLRGSTGSLVLGQDQDCLGSCFSNSNAFDGDMALLRVWNRVLSQDEVRCAAGSASFFNGCYNGSNKFWVLFSGFQWS